MLKKDAKIAVIGAGAAGLTAAYLLGREYRVTLFERNEHCGGHVRTVVVPEGPNAAIPVDTAFMIYHERGYPLFVKLLNQLGINGKKAEMSFSFTQVEDRVFYSTRFPGGLFSQKMNLFRPSFYRLLADIRRFDRKATADFQNGKLKGISVGDYLAKLRLSKSFLRHYLTPLKAMVWTVPQHEMMDYPAESFARFLLRYGLIGPRRNEYWMTIPGGSCLYVNAILNRIRGEVKMKSEIQSVRRTNEKVLVKEKYGFENIFDYAVIATHADEALSLLEDPTAEERRLLAPWVYVKNRTVLHSDESLMPSERMAWASWNCVAGREQEGVGPISITCHMNRLAKLRSKYQYFVTTNSHQTIQRDKIIKETEYRHPVFSFDCLRLQPELHKLNDPNGRTFFCGSYFGAGFHEDAVKSALDAIAPFCLSL